MQRIIDYFNLRDIQLIFQVVQIIELVHDYYIII